MSDGWTDVNQRHLMRAVAEVRAALERHAGMTAGAEATTSTMPPVGPTEPPSPAVAGATDAADEARPVSAPPALETLSQRFGLSSFERDVLVLCAGVELDASFAAACAVAQGISARAYPTFSLALAALPEPHWSALAPAAPLRRWRLVELAAQPGTPLTVAPLRI